MARLAKTFAIMVWRLLRYLSLGCSRRSAIHGIRNWKRSNQSVGGFGIFEPPDPSEFERYRNKQYPGWLESVGHFFEGLPGALEKPGRFINLELLMKNEGTRPAEHFEIAFQALGGVQFAPPKSGDAEEEESLKLAFPRPPLPPTGKWRQRRESSLDYLSIGSESSPDYLSLVDPRTVYSSLADFRPPVPRERSKFYWKVRPSGYSDLWTFECEEFRHRTEVEVFSVTLYIPTELQRPNVAVRCRASARNRKERYRWRRDDQRRSTIGWQ